MITIDRRMVHADLPRVFAAARDVERWPQILPHYRWVRYHRKDGGEGAGRVEMAAWRPFGPLPGWPTWWMSEMAVETDKPRIRYKHVRGITRGMDVSWEFVPQNGSVLVTITHWWDGPRWPLIGGLAASAVIGPVFIHGIASRTLEGVARTAEQGAANA